MYVKIKIDLALIKSMLPRESRGLTKAVNINAFSLKSKLPQGGIHP